MPLCYETTLFLSNTEVLQNPVLFDRLEVLKWIAGVVLARTCLAGSNPRSSTQIVKLHGASSIQPAPWQVRQGREAAAVAGRSGVIWVACAALFESSLRKLQDVEQERRGDEAGAA